MAYVSLYRKYRPQTFAEVVGQDHIVGTLANAAAAGQPHHAYLFTGPRGTGKTSTARILAKALNCVQGPTAEPCGICEHCSQIASGSHVDVIEIDAASHGGVDDVRELRERVALAPATAATKVYIVDECHMLSVAGWNAFLKTVEEPPGHVVFVFATTEPHKVLPTILSRTQRFDFRRVGATTLSGHVHRVAEREGLQLDEAAVDLIVHAGDGSVRDTLSVLEQVVAFSGPAVSATSAVEALGVVPEQLLSEAVDHLAAGDAAGLCVLVQRLVDGGIDPRQFARDCVERLRALFLLQVAPDADLVAGTPEQLARWREQTGRLGRIQLLRAVELLADAQALMRRGNTRLPLEIAFVKAALPEASSDVAALAARLDRLEQGEAVTPATPPRPQQAATPQPDPRQPQPDPQRPAKPEPEAAPEPAAPAQPEPPAKPEPVATPEPEPVATPEPEPRPEIAAAADLDTVRQLWPAVLERAKGRSRQLHAFLLQANPTAVEGGLLTLGFGARFHADQCASPQWAPALAEVVAEVVGTPLRVHCQVRDDDPEPAVDGGADEEAASVADAEAAADAGELPSDNEVHDQAIHTLTRDLGAAVVEDGRGQ